MTNPERTPTPSRAVDLSGHLFASQEFDDFEVVRGSEGSGTKTSSLLWGSSSQVSRGGFFSALSAGTPGASQRDASPASSSSSSSPRSASRVWSTVNYDASTNKHSNNKDTNNYSTNYKDNYKDTNYKDTNNSDCEPDPHDSQSEIVTAELVDVDVPASLVAGLASHAAQAWSYDWDDVPTKQRSPTSVSSKSSASAASLPTPFSSATKSSARTHYWPFTDRAFKKSFRKRALSKRISKSKSQDSLTATRNPRHWPSCRGIPLTLTALLITLLAVLLRTISAPPTTSPPTCPLHTAPTRNTTTPPPPSPLPPILHLLDKSHPQLLHLFESLHTLPSGLSLSLSAHTSLSLATVIESLASTSSSLPTPASASFDTPRVCDSLRDLSHALNQAADGLVGLQSEAAYCGRGVVRMLEGLVRGADAYLGIEREVREGMESSHVVVESPTECGACAGGGGEAKWLSWFHNPILLGTQPPTPACPSTRTTPLQQHHQSRLTDLQTLQTTHHQHLSTALASTLDETDMHLSTLETHLFHALERASIVHAVWQGANGVAERERRKVGGVVQEVKDGLELADVKRREGWLNSGLGKWREWIGSWNQVGGGTEGHCGQGSDSWSTNHSNNNNHPQITPHSLYRLTQDLELLTRVISSLHDMAPGMIEMGQRVKQMRASVQRFRSDLKSGSVFYEYGREGEGEMERIKGLVAGLREVVGSYRG
ncbi:hypothetical protein HDU98_009773 [Podochytrium sp. JEL0797]|nr:hypothetical protein HDU98_009773 [Podochytrium sp. JEL0797]